MEEEDETEDDDDSEKDDGGSSSGGNNTQLSFGGKHRRDRLKNQRKLKMDQEEDDDVVEERFRKGGDFFDATESVNIIQFSRPQNETGGVIRMFEGIDPDGIYCVSFSNFLLAKLINVFIINLHIVFLLYFINLNHTWN